MELFDDWSVHPAVAAPSAAAAAAAAPRASASRRSSAPALPAVLTPQAIADQLGMVEPPVVQVNCYDDVGYSWVQVSFDTLIDPAVALLVGQRLAALGGDIVRFNSLRPQAVYFVLDAPASDPPPDLPASRYGVTIAELAAAWRGGARGRAARKRPSR